MAGEARSRDGPGQAAVELALALPLLLVVLLSVVQIGLVVRAQLLVTHAAREGARAAAVDATPGAAAAAAAASADLDPSRLTVRTSGRAGAGSRVEVEVRYLVVTDVPIVGAFVVDVTVRSTATMRVEAAGAIRERGFGWRSLAGPNKE
jgi:Flp pilus assembly protein TadG